MNGKVTAMRELLLQGKGEAKASRWTWRGGTVVLAFVKKRERFPYNLGPLDRERAYGSVRKHTQATKQRRLSAAPLKVACQWVLGVRFGLEAGTVSLNRRSLRGSRQTISVHPGTHCASAWRRGFRKLRVRRKIRVRLALPSPFTEERRKAGWIVRSALSPAKRPRLARVHVPSLSYAVDVASTRSQTGSWDRSHRSSRFIIVFTPAGQRRTASRNIPERIQLISSIFSKIGIFSPVIKRIPARLRADFCSELLVHRLLRLPSL